MEVGGFVVDGGMKMTMAQVHINVQKYDFRGGGVPSEFDEIAAIEVFKEVGEGVGTMRPKEENIATKMQPEAALNKSLSHCIRIFETSKRV